MHWNEKTEYLCLRIYIFCLFIQFFYILLLSYKPSNFAQQYFPMPQVKGLTDEDATIFFLMTLKNQNQSAKQRLIKCKILKNAKYKTLKIQKF